MTIKQEKFCDEYILSGGNSAAAALKQDMRQNRRE